MRAPLLQVEGTVAAAAQNTPIKIGLVLPYAGPMNIHSDAVEAAMRLALDEVGGKISGDVVLVIDNDEAKPRRQSKRPES